ncbi:Acyl transferase [Catenulispora acidiphila DSM 44928]|uniref:Acyl transferase n=1 Tax=Catenulispora acidiphila (strain DSM 44928 / JCM 14897 / NBRC 102108 / NRRL B-24433 / ID139908) TaxID=479433 RepID=C7Q565_CATAD|nr:type I polyketide synthase [Catenulispora acidiphila]ACU75834.1 Acyl transferase [Catenulispora acidiphila DSM 44928]
MADVVVEPVAVIGLACRLPGADGPDALWRLLRAGGDAVTEAPEERWPSAALPDFRFGGFVDGVDRFDAAFFGISPHEAAAMDPQQRLALELAWEALENARLVPGDLAGAPVGVFLGAIASDYAVLAGRNDPAAQGAHSYTGAHRAMIANRVSYALQLRGPSLTLDAGQSSSLLAVRQACQSLAAGESTVALAGGVNLNLLAETTAAIAGFGALSPTGRCRVFDAAADGYVRGEGGAMVVLKPLAAARRDGDPVLAVVLGGAVNNDGGGEGLTVPRAEAQREVVELACREAGVRPGEVQYVELHGTGTRVGDPVEAAALGAALGGAHRTAERPLLVGSVKTNIGHLEGAAGIAGLVKVVLSLRHRELPASLHFRTPNPDIPLDELRLHVVQETTPWPVSDSERGALAGISSVGMGGTNCHLVLGAAPDDVAVPIQDSALPWVVSARSPEALRGQAAALVSAVTADVDAEADADADADGADPALALLRTRSRFEYRAVIDAAGTGARADRLGALTSLADGMPDGTVILGTATRGKRAFVFPGQGSQWIGMAVALLDTEPVFAARIAECEAALRLFVDYELTDVLRGAPDAPDFDRVDVVQPALWAVMVALAELWRSRGVQPDLVIGHSQGEIAAATVVGALSLTDGARVVALRSKAITRLAGAGGMLSVAAPLEVVRAALTPEATVAAVNGPRSVVVSGPVGVLETLQTAFEDAGHRAKLVPVDYASHSEAVEAIREELLEVLAPVSPRSCATEFVSCVTGQPIDTAELDAEYWYRNLRLPVRFADAARHALDEGVALFVECSAHPVLTGALEESVEAAERTAAVVGTLQRGVGGPDRFRQALAEAYVAGAPVDWTGALDVRSNQLAELPTYAFQRKRYWLAETATASISDASRPAAALAAPTPVAALAASIETAVTDRRALRNLVIATTADVLGHSDASAVRPDWRFKELGVDSAASVQLRNRLRAATGLALPTGVLFDYPSPDQLADRMWTLSQGADPASDSGARSVVEDPDPIVIVGMGCRYPGGIASPEDLWQLVVAGGEAVSDFPADRGWDFEALFAEGGEVSGTSSTRRGGFLRDADKFDAAFFGISPREAAAMDPQQRLMLEVCWEAAERAGLDAEALRGSRTGVFVGAMAPDYGPRLHLPSAGADGHLLTGMALSVVSGRIAYSLGLTGPALTIDTACSSSLVAMHLAAQALRRGECDMALAGGVTVMATAGMFVEFSRQGGLSQDGRCKAFSAEADGTGWAEGAGVILLERLSDARRAGHPVLAVLRGSAVNQDGHSNGLTAPSGPAQERVIRAALADAGLAATDVDAVEAHGTGTRLGDPIEAEALLAAYGADRPADRPLWLGSVKTNIGHTQAAAGTAGVIKMVEALRHGMLPRTLHADHPTGHVDWSRGTVRLLTEPVELPVEQMARAAVSSFGISGTNAHVIIERAPELEAEHEVAAATPLVWVFSARTASALRNQATRLRTFAADASASDLLATGPTLALRTAMEHRAVVVAQDRDELLAALDALAEGRPHPATVQGTASGDVRPVFVFPGQGSQWAGMALELLTWNADFRAAFELCDAALAPYTGWSVADVLAGRDGAPALEGSDVIQPTLFAVMVSLAALWRSAGVEPAAVIGHSQGEITAACVAGALDLPDAARIVALRSKALMKLTGTGALVAVSLPAEQVRELLGPWEGRLWVAILSGPSGTVVGGDPDACEEFAASLGSGVQARRVAIDYAAHTPHIEALREDLLSALAGVEPRATDVAFCSSAEGRFVAADALTAEYWYLGLRNPVQFEQAIRQFGDWDGTPLFVESSPHPVLIGNVQDTLRTAEMAGDAFGTLRRNDGGPRRFLLAAAQAYVAGAPVNWRAVLGTASHQVVPPTYPFEHQRFWIEGSPSRAAAGHPLIDTTVRLAEGDGLVLSGRLSTAATPWLADHAVDGNVLLPGTAFVEMALQAAAAAGSGGIDELMLAAPVVLSDGEAVEVQLTVGAPDERGRRPLGVYTRQASGDEDAWTRNATATLLADTEPLVASWEAPADDASETNLDGVYDWLSDHGYEYGPSFQGLLRVVATEGARFIDVALPEAVRADAGRFMLHPALLDAVLHPLVRDSVGEDDMLVLPFAFSGVRVAARGAEALSVRVTELGADRVALVAFDSAGQPVLGVEELTLRRVPRRQAASGPVSYTLAWNEFTVPEVEPAGQRVAVVGTDAAADELRAALAALGAEATLSYDLPSLPDMTAGQVPETVFVPYRPDVDPFDLPYSVHEGLYQVLDLIQGWVADERFAGSRLVFTTSGAIDGTDDGLAAAPLWGLVRSAQTEHPGRFAIIDIAVDVADATDAQTWRSALGALATGRSQLVIRDGIVRVPRLVRADVTTEASVDLPDLPDIPDLTTGTVLITGGTGGLGALVARRLIESHGVRHLLLASRRGAAAPGAAGLETELTALGASVTIAACDVSSRPSVAALLDTIPADQPLACVVHTAGVLDDAPVAALSTAHLDEALAAKADGAWHLHELTEKTAPGAMFVLFSSVAGTVGTAGQGNYAAANSFLDTLAAARHRQGRPAVSVVWGLWADHTGMTGTLTDADLARLARTGVAPLPTDQGLEYFDSALRSDDALTVAARWDLAALRARVDGGGAVPEIFDGLVRTTRRAPAPTAAAASAPRAPGNASAPAAGSQSMWTSRLAGLSQSEGVKLLAGLVRAHAAAVLGHASADAVDADRAFTELGFDSLTAVELRNRVDSETGLRMPASMAFDYPTVAALAAFLHTELAPAQSSPEDTLREALEHVQAVLPDTDESTRTKLVALLRSGLDRLGPASAAAEQAPATPADAVLDPAAEATDEEIFAYIDRQFSEPPRV